jgi:hypothetical protein
MTELSFTTPNLGLMLAPAPVAGTTAGTFAAGDDPRLSGGGWSALNAVVDYGAVGNGSTDDTTALQAWVAACLAQDKPGYLPPGTYKITAALDARGDGLVLSGGGMANSRIVQFTANTAVVKVGGQFQAFSDMAFEYNTQQTSAQTSGNCVEFYTSYFSDFQRIYTYGGARHWWIPQVNDQGTGQNGMFSNSFMTLRGLGATIGYMHLQGYIGYSTGSIFNNVYFNNKVGSSILAMSGAAVYIDLCDEIVFNQLNIEDVDLSLSGSTDKVLWLAAKNTVINGLHFERCKLGSFQSAPILVSGSSGDAKATIKALTASFCEFPASTGDHGIVQLYQAQADVSAVRLTNLLRAVGITLYLFHVIDTTGTQAVANLVDLGATLGATSTMGTTGQTWATGAVFGGTYTLGDSTTVPTVKRINDIEYARRNSGGKNILAGTAAPTTGTWVVGDTVWNTTPSAGGTPGWVCTTAGTPGTWKAMASVAA